MLKVAKALCGFFGEVLITVFIKNSKSFTQNEMNATMSGTHNLENNFAITKLWFGLYLYKIVVS